MPPERRNPWVHLLDVLSRRRLLVLPLALVTVGLSILTLPTIPFETDPASSLPGDSPAVQYWVEMSQRFEAFSTLMVGLEEPGAGLSPEGLAALAKITAEVDQLKDAGVRQARSLSNMQAARRGPDGALDLGGAMEEIPETPAEREALGARIRSDPNLRGSFVSPDGRAYLVIIQLEPDRVAEDATAQIRQVVEDHRGPLRVVYFGAPFVGEAISTQLAERAPRLAATGAVLFLVPLFLIGWRIGAILVVLLSTAASLLLWFGLLGVFHVQVCSETGLAALAVAAVAMALFSRAAGERTGGGQVPGSLVLSPRTLFMTLGAALAMGGAALVTPQPVTGFALAVAVGMIAVLVAALLVFVPVASWLRQGVVPAAERRPRARPLVAVLLGLAVFGVGILGATQTTFRTLPGTSSSRRIPSVRPSSSSTATSAARICCRSTQRGTSPGRRMWPASCASPTAWRGPGASATYAPSGRSWRSSIGASRGPTGFPGSRRPSRISGSSSQGTTTSGHWSPRTVTRR